MIFVQHLVVTCLAESKWIGKKLTNEKGGLMAYHDSLNDSLTKERGGRHGGKGHEFQRYWALCHLLKIDLEQNDFVLLVEFIEDVAVLDAENAPSSLLLYQLKKKEGGAKWTKTTLTKPPKDSISILAKLFESRRISPDGRASIAFVSNAPVDLPLNSGEDATQLTEFDASELEPTLRSSLISSIANELTCAEADIEFEKLKFIQSPLALNDLENHAIGLVSTYLGSKFPDHSARADVFCKALYGEIKIRATATQDASSFDELCRIRGIAKSQLNSMLATTMARKPDNEIFESAIAALVHENVSFNNRNQIKNASRRYLIDKAGKGSAVLAVLDQVIVDTWQRVPDSVVTSWEAANWIADQINLSSHVTTFAMLERSYLLAVILYRINQ
jgi:hypothetical protein